MLRTAVLTFSVLLFSALLLAQDEPDSATGTSPDAQTETPTDEVTPGETGAEAAPAAPIERHNPNPNQWRIEDVRRFLSNFARTDEILSFEQQDGTVSGLYLPENTGKPQGGVLILHDVEQHAHWPQTVAPLREYLPDYGWNTLSLFMNQGIKKPLPKVERAPRPAESSSSDAETQTEAAGTDGSPAPAEAEPAAETANAEETAPLPEDNSPIDDGAPPSDELDAIADSLDEIPDLAAKADAQQEQGEEEREDPAEAYIKNSTDRVSAGISQLNTLGQFNLVIIAHGANANWATAALNEIYERTPDAKGLALILVDARSTEYPPYPLNSMLANLDIPILDLVTINEEIPLQRAIDRRNTMRRSQRENYQQIKIPAVRSPLRGKHNTLTRRVRGWLQNNAAGEEVEIKG